MGIKYGDLLKQLRMEKNLTQQELAKRASYTKQHVSRIENNEVAATYMASVIFSRILNFDFVKLSRNIQDFNSYQDYVAYYKLKNAIDHSGSVEIEKTLIELDINETFNYGELVLLKDYANAIVKFYKDYNECISHCLKALNIEEDELQNLSFDNLIEDIKLHIYLVLGTAYVLIDNKEIAISIYENIYKHCKTVLFNEESNHIEQSFFIKKLFILTINNIAHMKFVFEDYNTSIEFCDEALKYIRDFNILYVLHNIYKLKMENHYKLEEFDYARKYYNYVEMLCEISDKSEYFETTRKLVTEKYPKILEKDF